jgi:hypothetical protein
MLITENASAALPSSNGILQRDESERVRSSSPSLCHYRSPILMLDPPVEDRCTIRSATNHRSAHTRGTCRLALSSVSR